MTESELIKMYGKEEISLQKTLIQGYIPSVYINGKYFYVKFDRSGLTNDYQKSECVSSEKEAIDIAINFVNNYCNIPCAKALNGLNEIII